MKKNIFPMLLIAFFLVSNAFGANYYVSTSGSDSNAGTEASPFKTLTKAITVVGAGDIIYMRGGTHAYSASILIARGNNGTSSATKKIFAYPNETPVLSFSAMAESSSNRGIILDALYWHLKGLIIEAAGDNGLLLAGNNNTIESCIFRKNKDTGLQLSRYNTSYSSISEWPTNNLILNCEAYDNKDSGNENADGFAAKLTCGNGNIFRGCVSHNNIDDGWDLYTKPDTGPIGSITLENCIAHSNGVLTTGGTSGSGDKNGFKLGGEDISVNHIVRRCIAFNNGKHGFTYNRNLGTIEVTNNSAYNNAERNFNFDGGTSKFTNNLSYHSSSHTDDRLIGTVVGATNAFWASNATTNFTVNSADFTTLTPGAVAAPTANGFLNLVSSSDLINKGSIVSGITYNGSSPDIGAIEFGGTTPVTYTLTVNATPSAGGSVTKSPSATSYSSGTVVTLTAVPVSGYAFSGWSGDASGTSATTTVTMSANKTVTATFTLITTSCSWVEYQMESGTRSSGAIIETVNSGYTGASYVNTDNVAGSWAQITVNPSTAGTYNLRLRYANAGTIDRAVSVSVNGSVKISSLSLPVTGAWTTWVIKEFSVALNAGSNTILFTALTAEGAPNLDRLDVCQGGSSARTIASVEPELNSQIMVSQNYPNPVENSTTIGLWLKNSSKVKIGLYNNLGSRVAVIADKRFEAGYHEVQYNKNGLISGHYVYVVETEKGSQVKHMIIK